MDKWATRRLAVLAHHQDERSKCCEDTSCKVFPLPAVCECGGEPRGDMECVREGLYARGGPLFVSHGGLVGEGEGEGEGSGSGSGTCRNVNRLRTSTDCLQIIPSTRRSCGARHYVMRKQITAPAAVHVIDNDTSASPYHTAMSLRDKSCYTLTIHPSNTDPAIFELIESVGPATGNEKPRYARVKETREDESYSSAIYGMYR